MAAAGLSELEQEFYKDLLVVAEPEPTPEPEPEVTPEPEAEVVPEPEPTPEPVKEPVVETVIPEYKSNKKYIPLDDEKTIYETLDKKYRYDRMKPEEKALAFIAQQNPGLDESDLAFIAATEYGIGVERPDEAELTDAQMLEIKKQDIARKQLLNKADAYFKEEAGKITIDGQDPLELDPDYKAYREAQAAAQAKQAEEAQNLQNTIIQIETAAKTISELKVPTEIDIDDRKFAVDVNFKIDAEKQKQLAEFTKRYTPTEDELTQYTIDGKFDFKAYQEELANRLFYKDIVKAALRQGLSQDREQFIEKELKNSTLRNNDVSETVKKDFDIVDVWPFGK